MRDSDARQSLRLDKCDFAVLEETALMRLVGHGDVERELNASFDAFASQETVKVRMKSCTDRVKSDSMKECN